MSEVLKTYQANLQRLINDWGAITDKVLDDNADVYADMNVEQQVNYGIKADGSQIGQYSPFTIKLKQKKGQETRFVTLEDTGDYHKAFFGKVQSGKLIISSKDNKLNELKKKYGDTFGLIPDLRRRVSREMVLPDLVKTIRNKLKK